jgi:hypothetical protein
MRAKNELNRTGIGSKALVDAREGVDELSKGACRRSNETEP